MFPIPDALFYFFGLMTMIKFDKRTLELVLKAQTWGPLLVGGGAACLLRMNLGGQWAIGSRLALAGTLIVAGVVIMLVQISPKPASTSLAERADDASMEGLGRLNRQLANNYDLLRRQTTQGFTIILILMCLGVVVIFAGVFGATFGVATDVKVVVSLAGTVVEVLASTTLVVYRLNFKRLNETTESLEKNWRILSAYGLVGSLPHDQRAKATIMLIQSLVGGARIAHSATGGEQ
jgi:hypothetical protein